MRLIKIILMCVIPIVGIYSMNKIQFGEKLVIMLPGRAPVRRPGVPPGPPPQLEQGGPQVPITGGEAEIRPVQEMGQGRPQVPVAEGELLSQGPPTRPQVEEQSKWKIRIDFSRGIKSVGHLTLILAFLIELTFLADRLIRRKSLL